MRTALAFLLATALSLCASPNQARPSDGNEFHEKCKRAAQGDAVAQMVTQSFLIGVVETGYNLSKVYKRRELTCLPVGATIGEIENVFCKYLNDNPDERTARASILALFAFKREFPCK